MSTPLRPYFPPAKRTVMTWGIYYQGKQVATIQAKDKQDGGKRGEFPGAEAAYAAWCDANDKNPVAYTKMIISLGQ